MNEATQEILKYRVLLYNAEKAILFATDSPVFYELATKQGFIEPTQDLAIELIGGSMEKGEQILQQALDRWSHADISLGGSIKNRNITTTFNPGVALGKEYLTKFCARWFRDQKNNRARLTNLSNFTTASKFWYCEKYNFLFESGNAVVDNRLEACDVLQYYHPECVMKDLGIEGQFFLNKFNTIIVDDLLVFNIFAYMRRFLDEEYVGSLPKTAYQQKGNSVRHFEIKFNGNGWVTTKPKPYVMKGINND